MNIQQLEQIDAYSWRLPRQNGEECSEVLLYGSQELLRTMDEKVLEQIGNVAMLPGLVGPAMAMPDAHWGYGFPIGGVAAFDAEQGGIISAGGVGFDISCGIRCLRTDLKLHEIAGDLERLANLLYARIPAGLGTTGHLHLTVPELDEVLRKGAKWAVKQGYGLPDDLAFIEEGGCMENAETDFVSDLAKKRQLNEMGTLGSGNHYLEVQVVEKIYDETAARAFGISEGQILVSIHCGSRGLGHQIGSDYMITLAKEAIRMGITLPDRELACAPILSNAGQRYIGAMHAGINCALANRQILTHLTREVFDMLFMGSSVDTLYDVSHNTCKEERHVVEGIERTLWVHRKGATRAFGPGHRQLPSQYRSVGQPVIIGGSMGTGSYILAGSDTSEARSWASASHGAGRSMSRHQVKKQWRGSEVLERLEGEGIHIRSDSMRGIAEEAPEAYKDVDEVAEVTEKAGLARRVAFLRPKVCIKG